MKNYGDSWEAMKGPRIRGADRQVCRAEIRLGLGSLLEHRHGPYLGAALTEPLRSKRRACAGC